jgi:hypothetical protein
MPASLSCIHPSWTAGDRAPKNTTYLWGVADQTYPDMIDSFYRAWMNLKSRAEHEHAQMQAIAEKKQFKTAEDDIKERKLLVRVSV